MYREGLTTRAIGEILGKSHQWVWTAVKDMAEEDKKKSSAI